VRLQKQEKENRSDKPEKVLLYFSPTICSPSFSFMGGVAKTEKKGVPNVKRYYLL
jgi:hypothetical protein